MSNTSSNPSPQTHPFIQKALDYISSLIKSFIDGINNYLDRMATINMNHKKYINGQIPVDSMVYQKYQDAVLKNKIGEKRLNKILDVYSQFLYQKQNKDFLPKEQFLELLTIPQNYIVFTKSDYQKQIAAIKQNFQKQAQDQLRKKNEAFRQSLIQQLLPFTSTQEENQLSDFLRKKDATGMKYYAQRKKMEELKERERKLDIKEEKLDVQNERIELKSDKLDIQKEKLSVQQLVFDNERKLFAIEMQTRDLEHKMKMTELLDLSLDLKQKSYNIERFKQEFEIMQGLHDLEMRNREQLLSHGQQMLELQEQGLENKMTLREAEFVRQQNKNNALALDIESKLLKLQENTFTQMSNEILLNIREKFFSIKKEHFELDLREQNMNDKLHEQRMSILNEKAHLELRHIQMEEERERTLFKLHNTELNNQQLKFEKSRLIQDLKNTPKY